MNQIKKFIYIWRFYLVGGESIRTIPPQGQVILIISLFFFGLLAYVSASNFITTNIIGRNIWSSRGESDIKCSLNSSYPISNYSIVANKIVIPGFNTYNNPVSIIITSSLIHDVILNHTQVSGTNVSGIIYPTGPPSQSIDATMGSAIFNISIFWEETDTDVSFTYQSFYIVHVDNWVTVTQPEYYTLTSAGILLLGSGVIVLVLFIYIKLRK